MLAGTPRDVLYLVPECFSPGKGDGQDDHQRECLGSHVFPSWRFLLAFHKLRSLVFSIGVLFCYEMDNSPASEEASFLHLDTIYLTRLQV